MRLLAAGVMVARTADDLARYHDKFMIVDRKQLYVLAFNFTYLDTEHSRSFGIITCNRRLVQEAGKLFEADLSRQPYLNGLPNFIVSPVNARKQLSAFLKKARQELLIYDPDISDPAMLRLLEERAAAGVSIKIIGKVSGRRPGLASRRLTQMRLHTRAILRDGTHAFIGSQSLRELELEKRREVGIVLRDRKVVQRMQKIFLEDWNLAQDTGETAEPVARVAKRVAKAVARQLPPVAPVLEVIVREVGTDLDLSPDEVEETVKQAVKEAVKEAVKDVVEHVAESDAR